MNSVVNDRIYGQIGYQIIVEEVYCLQRMKKTLFSLFMLGAAVSAYAQTSATYITGQSSDISFYAESNIDFDYSQSSAEYIYGEITTRGNQRFKGFIRWGKEEIAWHDVFNSVKENNKESSRYIIHMKNKDEDKSIWKDFNWNISSIWEDKYRQIDHTFACFFGDIKALYPLGNNRLKLELKNGKKLLLNGGTNDVGTELYVFDYKQGKVNIPWNKVDKIEFMQAPHMSRNPYGKLIYGTVYTYRKGAFEGYIKWDLDERVTNDLLDGFENNKEYRIPFGDIKKIKKHPQGSFVVDVHGKELLLNGTNDVNASNRGIAMYVDGVGRLEIPWKEFKSIGIHEPHKAGYSYNDFLDPQGIEASVYTYSGDEYYGKIVFDIDEKWELEFLDGNDDNINYQIPFRNIRTIYPKNKFYSIVILNNGKELLLGERQDVSGSNDGILIFEEGEEEPSVIEWADITEVSLHH